MSRVGTGLARRREETARGAAARTLAPVGARLVGAFERGLVRALARRLDGGAPGRAPGGLEQRLVAGLERRLPNRRRVSAAGRGQALAWSRLGQSIRPRRSRQLSVDGPTMRALVLHILARRMVWALARVLRILGRGVVSAPIRRLAGVLARRVLGARTARRVGLLAVILGALALLVRRVGARLSGWGAARTAASLRGLRPLRAGLTALGDLAARLLRTLTAMVRSRAKSAPTARSSRVSAPQP